ncbi:hypothetical protein [Frigoribacterium sp. UYMn621]|uniref:hypothetical protein n=1 Tax=Frigoribacterium sp. UYMn621 TaxID=3156343 RepID=UPI0033946880
MGMYTEINFRAEMVPEWANDPKVGMAFTALREGSGYGTPREILPEHEFFDCDRWASVASCGSYYFPLGNHNEWVHDYQGGYYWSFRANLKNYDDEINKFFDWVDPYIREGEGTFLGYSLYEQGNQPIHFFKKGESRK